MHQVVINIEMSSVTAHATVVAALSSMDHVTLQDPVGMQECHLTVVIQTDDPDVVDIVREIAWEHDPRAVQHSLHLAEVS
ncbi:hypothetical protein [Aeromicrobium sp.]|uniref:hypothetical protein n=1 Tax=Aeromicrobium sp. TaxID=1871063 RepID=UPI0019A17124|nr:hypothetical protein [Aeromicrobium sp.]MBC7630069.1 hypothetical protein [Aeromicrobium sp.]